jgi:hypothetical protein
MYNLSQVKSMANQAVSTAKRIAELDEECLPQFQPARLLINHQLAGIRCSKLPRLIELSKRIAGADVSYHSGDVPLTTVLHQGPRTGLSVEKTIRRIEECRSWMVLKHVEQDRLMRRCSTRVWIKSRRFLNP